MATDEFVPSRTLDVESRIRHIEDWASQFSGRQSVDPSAVESAGGSGSTGGGSGSPVTLIGDVTGPTTANVVTAIRGAATPVPAAGDNHKALVYAATGNSYLLRHLQFKNRTVLVDTTLTADDLQLFVDASAGPVTVNLPTAIGIKDTAFAIKKIDDSANAVFVTAFDTQYIDGTLAYSITTPMEGIVIVSDDVNWWIAAGWIPPTIVTSVPGYTSSFGFWLGSVGAEPAVPSGGYRSLEYWWMGGSGE